MNQLFTHNQHFLDTSRNKKRKRDSDEADEKFLSALHGLEAISVNAIVTSKKTEFDIFRQSISAQLNNISLEDALQLQLEIQQLITRKRINYRMQLLSRQLQRNSNNSPSQNSHSPVPNYVMSNTPGTTSTTSDFSQDSIDDSISYF
ncbi:uncharacterized protein LOC114881095 [Osmia bicornis bicornis]|uniref:uncharacterized protein LOC114881095 n=1 Tax=Osmia bicornis bicornis TaxID=1437191 RepID=UPI001EAEA8FF|nr:uncharacterized protein LOC114881095 [Osmia bicornis bicornis]